MTLKSFLHSISLLLVFLSAKSECATSYKILDVSGKASVDVTAVSLNDADEVLLLVGNGPYGMQSKLYKSGDVTDLKLARYPDQLAIKLTNQHNVIGVAQTKLKPNIRTFYLDPLRQLHWLVGPGNCEPSDMNRNGESVGVCHKVGGKESSIAVWDSKGAFREILLPYHSINVTGWITNSDILVSGMSNSPPFFRSFVVDVKTGIVRQDLAHQQAWHIGGVRNDGAFVGYLDDPFGRLIPFEFFKGKVIRLPIGQGADSEAKAIAEDDKIVGTTYHGTATNRTATLWVGNKNYDLNFLCKKRSGWVLQEAVAINARGAILCQGSYHGRERACLLVPEQKTTHLTKEEGLQINR